jgi:hypothetical protein
MRRGRICLVKSFSDWPDRPALPSCSVRDLPRAVAIQSCINDPKPSTTLPASTGRRTTFALARNASVTPAAISSHRNCARSSC